MHRDDESIPIVSWILIAVADPLLLCLASADGPILFLSSLADEWCRIQQGAVMDGGMCEVGQESIFDNRTWTECDESRIRRFLVNKVDICVIVLKGCELLGSV